MQKLTLIAAAFALTAAIATPAAAGQRMMSQPTSYDANAFWPGDVAEDLADGTIAAASEPFGGDAYTMQEESYARRNGFVCMPGSTFRGQDGRWHLCQ